YINHDFDKFRFLQIYLHHTHLSPISCKRWMPVTLSIDLHQLEKIEIDFVTRAVLHQGSAIAVANLTANRWNSHGCLGAATNPSGPLRPTRHLHPPKAGSQRTQAEQHQQPEKLQPQERTKSWPVHMSPRRGR